MCYKTNLVQVYWEQKQLCLWSHSTFCTDDSCGMNIDCLRIRIVEERRGGKGAKERERERERERGRMKEGESARAKERRKGGYAYVLLIQHGWQLMDNLTCKHYILHKQQR